MKFLSTRIKFCKKTDLQDIANIVNGVPGTVSVFDFNTAALFPLESYGNIENKSRTVILQPGEHQKRWESVEKIISAALYAGAGRDSVFIGIGGGVICDLAGFASSVYMRGARLILVPTTLLAMADAALGGKTGFDFHGYKNMVGSFYPAEEIVICSELLETLPAHEYSSGLAEVIKHALLADSELYAFLLDKSGSVAGRDPEALEFIISRSLMVKGGYIEKDPKEQGIRAHLNFGHTFAHSLESAVKFFGWSHGDAVVWGMGRALQLGCLLGITDSGYAEESLGLFRMYGYKLDAPGIDIDILIEGMKKDKKKKGGEVRFVLQRKHGETVLMTVEEALLRTCLQERLDGTD